MCVATQYVIMGYIVEVAQKKRQYDQGKRIMHWMKPLDVH